MNDFDAELINLHKNISSLATKKNRAFAWTYRVMGEFIGTVFVGIFIYLLIKAL